MNGGMLQAEENRETVEPEEETAEEVERPEDMQFPFSENDLNHLFYNPDTGQMSNTLRDALATDFRYRNPSDEVA